MTPNLVLDDTLRYLYITLRKVGAHLVGVKFIHNGKRWEADTPEEAIQLRKQLEVEDLQRRVSDPETADWHLRQESPWTPDVFWNFINSLQLRQLNLMRVLWLNNGMHGITSTGIAKAMHMHETKLAGTLSGLSKLLKTMGLKPYDLYSVDTAWSGKEKTRTFHLQRSFCLAAEEAGWPEEKEGTAHAPATNDKRK